VLCACVAPLFPGHAFGQDERGRKYKAPPVTAHVVVAVTKASNGKPVVNASVIFHPIKDGKDEGNLEIKSDPDGKATIDVIPIGSLVTVQVFADGFATFAQDYTLTDAEKDINVKLQRPRAQLSTYVDNTGKPAQIQPGVQEQHRPAPAPQGSSAPAPPSTPTPPSTPAPQASANPPAQSGTTPQ
jgi:Carboxypeptidase regulatory-like domain